jgi:hypothetical protein
MKININDYVRHLNPCLSTACANGEFLKCNCGLVETLGEINKLQSDNVAMLETLKEIKEIALEIAGKQVNAQGSLACRIEAISCETIKQVESEK